MPSLEDLPPKLQLRIMRHMVAEESDKIVIISASYGNALFNSRFPFSFISPGCAAFSNINTTHNKSAAINYRYAVLEHIMNDDGDVYATVRDLQFHNVKKFVTFLQAKNKLRPFLVGGGRAITIIHAVTKGFPVETARLQRWAKFTDSLTNERARKKLAPHHLVSQQHDTNANSRLISFLRAADNSQDHQKNYNQFSAAMNSFYGDVGERLQDSLIEVEVAGLTEEQQDELDFDTEYIQANAKEYPE